MTQTDYVGFLKTLETTSPGGELFSSTDTVSKDKVLSIRIEPGLHSLLEALTEQWNTGTVSGTARAILSMFFLPSVYEYEWKNLTPEMVAEFYQVEQEQGFSVKLFRLHKFLSELAEYMTFLKEAETKGSASMEFIQQKREQVESMVEQLAGAELSLKEGLSENKKKKK